MDYEKTLVALHGFVGRRVSVSIQTHDTRGQPYAVVAWLEGILARAHDIRHPSLEGEAMLFQVGDTPANGFLFEPGAFESASWALTAGDALLEVRVAGLTMLIGLAPDDE